MPSFRIDPEFAALLPRTSPRKYAKLSLLIETYGPKPGSLTVADILGDHILIDGHNTYSICIAKKIALPPAVVIKFPSRELAMEWMLDNQESRRDTTEQELAQLRKDRVERVAQAAAQGQSTREIAKAEGIDQKTVRRDLAKAASEAPASPPPANGQDAAPSGNLNNSETIFCDRCKRVGPTKDCPKCELLRRHKPKRKKRPKSGRVKKEADPLHAPIGACLKAIDAWYHTIGIGRDSKKEAFIDRLKAVHQDIAADIKARGPEVFE